MTSKLKNTIFSIVERSVAATVLKRI